MGLTRSDLKRYLQQCQVADLEPSALQALIEPYLSTYEGIPSGTAVVLADSDPIQYLGAFLAGCVSSVSLFLGNPYWKQQEWSQALALIQTGYIQTQEGLSPFQIPSQPQSMARSDWIMIPTGGSSGQIRFAIHTWETLCASVVGFCDYFAIDTVHSVCVLPIYHVGGLMQLMRCLLTGGHFDLQSWKRLDLEETHLYANYCLSLVPTQLHRLLSHGIPWLQTFQLILVGGGSCWPALLNQARTAQIRLAPTYGMTETASQVATLKPSEFLQGSNSCGVALPHAQLDLQAPEGRITVQARSLALGYYPDSWFLTPTFETQDLGFWDSNHHLQILGRLDDLIITGGEKVVASEVEAAIRETQLVNDVCVLGYPDPVWGQRVVAVYVPARWGPIQSDLKAQLQTKITDYKCPKSWIAVKSLPRNPQGKLSKSQLAQLIQDDQL